MQPVSKEDVMTALRCDADPDFDQLANYVRVYNGNAMDVVYSDPDTSAQVFLGGNDGAKLATAANIQCVVYATHSSPCTSFPDIRCLQFKVDKWKEACSLDPTTDEVAEFFEPAMAFIDNALASGQNVLVHCKAGAHRAPCIVIAFLMRRLCITREQAITNVHSARRQVDVNVLNRSHFVTLLDSWDAHCRTNSNKILN